MSVRLFDDTDTDNDGHNGGGGGRTLELEGVEGGWWQTAATCATGVGYLFVVDTGNGVVERMDPCARAVTNSVGRCLVTDESFGWCHPDFQLAPIHELVIYELHPATFSGTLDDAADRLDHLVDLEFCGADAVAEFAGDVSWGYNTGDADMQASELTDFEGASRLRDRLWPSPPE